IGSIPTLEKRDIIEETKKTFDYLQVRSSKSINFHFNAPQKEIYSEINVQLFSWTIENLVKNAIDAMKGKGYVMIEILKDTKEVKSNLTDNGKRNAKIKYKNIFDPGHTSKKRGWGLELYLARRIIEEYLQSKIRVQQSKKRKGTTMLIILKLAEQ